MTFFRRAIVSAFLTLAASTLWAAAEPGVTFIGRGAVPGNALDKSGLAGSICSLANGSCIDKSILGGFGSAVTYTGFDNVFLAVPDRGPFDGRTNVPYLDRFHFVHLTIDTTKNPKNNLLNINWTLLDTRLLWSEAHENFVGSSSAINLVDPLKNLRFDPEGVRVSIAGTFFVSDEYGPYLNEFNREGHLIRRIPIPAKFLINNPTGDVNRNGDSFELYKYPFLLNTSTYGNNSGRQANRGMEGLAITPDGRYLVGIMQNALIQDHGLSYAATQTDLTTPSRIGFNNRILKYDLVTGQTWEYVYPMDAVNQGKGVNEILAINDHEFLVVERDNRSLVSPGADTFPSGGGVKKVFRIDLNKAGLTDVSNVAALPETVAGLTNFFGPGQSIVPVSKFLFLDLLNPVYEVDISTTPHKTIKDIIAEKIEGLAWGPDLPNGHHVLYVLSDNDLNTGFPTEIFAFEVDGTAAGITYQPQVLPGPLFPPGQVKQILSGKKDK